MSNSKNLFEETEVNAFNQEGVDEIMAIYPGLQPGTEEQKPQSSIDQAGNFNPSAGNPGSYGNAGPSYTDDNTTRADSPYPTIGSSVVRDIQPSPNFPKGKPSNEAKFPTLKLLERVILEENPENPKKVV